ncbi:hypothetical protein TrVE_jg11588 [Triparma verrucosa]|uniref:ABC1 atypical kinase-like domain-containing protein n=1 Tax=Triparma verrucosa TaxID=1606542 RepID=A0A9W7ERN7_9STRA|nr:hypothetical protein TrVE_jg11588 [Triparma verrucosa]
MDERVKWLNFPGMVEEFSELLKDQLDLNNEARNLQQFRKNFSDSSDVIFPSLIMSRSNVMIMEFVDGDTVWEFVERYKDDATLRNRVCDKGITAVCQMIFEHNFVHGDVHPGNILFSREEDPKLVLLDTGIAKRFTRRDHKLLVDVLGGFIQGDGASAGRAIIADSVNRTSIQSHNASGFVKILDDMCEKAKSDQSFFDSIGNYVTIICDGASKHKVMMNQGFVSIALTTRVMEGVALALNPAAEIWRIANKIVMKVKAEEMLGTAASKKRFEDEDEELRRNTFTRRGTKKVPP